MRSRGLAAPLVGVLTLALIATPSAPAPALDLIAPIDGPIIRHFEQPPTPYAAGHRGIDLGASEGTSVYAAAGGVVAFAGPVGGTRAVSIDHPDGHRTTYSYLSATTVRAGAGVTQGALIGRSGPGHAGETPAGLHFGLKRGDAYLDPEPVLVASMRANLQRVIRLVA